MDGNSPISGSPENTESGSPTPISTTSLVSLVGSGTVSTDGGFPSGELSWGSLVGSRKKRGRPRKYDAQGNLNPSYVASSSRISSSSSGQVSPPPGFSFTTSSSSQAHSLPIPNSSLFNTSNMPLGDIYANTAGTDFTTYIITVMSGEDIMAKIYAAGSTGPQDRSVCVLSANGCISNVTIRPPGLGGGLLTYEGNFEILNLKGTYTMSEVDGVTTTTGGLSISIASPDGRVMGGSVVGWLIAATPVQMVLGTFIPFGNKAPKKRKSRSSPTATVFHASPTAIPADIPNILQPVPLHEVGPLEVPPMPMPMPMQTHGEAEDNLGNGHNLNVASSEEWNNGLQERIYPDINVSIADE